MAYTWTIPSVALALGAAGCGDDGGGGGESSTGPATTSTATTSDDTTTTSGSSSDGADTTGIPTALLTIEFIGLAGFPDGAGTIRVAQENEDCESQFSPCTVEVEVGGVSLLPTPEPGHAFAGVEGADCVTDELDVCTFQVTEDTTVQVRFGQGATNPWFITALDYDLDGLENEVEVDRICLIEARAAGLDGEFIAWVSWSNAAQLDRLRGAKGWVRTDDRRVVQDIDGLVAGTTWYPPILGADGSLHNFATNDDPRVWTGTLPTGILGENCADFSDPDGMTNAGIADAAGSEITTLADVQDCMGRRYLYCAGVEYLAVLPELTADTGMTTFVTSGTLPAADLLTDGDALCNTEATAAGLPGTYAAMISTSAQSAFARATGMALPPDLIRPDGLLWATGAAEPLAAVLFEADGAEAAEPAVWTGSPTADAVAATPLTESCGDWTSSAPGNMGIIGVPQRAGSRWWNLGAVPCDASHAVYCVQQP